MPIHLNQNTTQWELKLTPEELANINLLIEMLLDKKKKTLDLNTLDDESFFNA